MPPFGFGPGGAALEGMPLISALTPAALAGMSVTGLQNGQIAYVDAMRVGAGNGEFVLQPLVSIAPDSFFVIPTFNDPLRQWVFMAIGEQLTLSVGTTVFVPPMNFGVAPTTLQLVMTKDGTITTAPTLRGGTNATNDNLAISQVPATIVTQATGTRVLLVAPAPLFGDLSLAALGIRFEVQVGAVLGTATFLRARVIITPNTLRAL